MRSEKLTVEEIKLDLMAKLDFEQTGKRSPASALLVWAFFILFMGLSLGITCLLGPITAGIVILSAAAVGFAGFLIGAVLVIRKVNKEMSVKRKWVENGEFRIVGDKLERARMDDNFRNEKSLSEGNDLLVFSRYGKYYIPLITHYTWSKDYYLSPDGVFNTSIEGDTFYLVIFTHDPTQKIAMAYNTKLFEWKEERYNT